MGLIGLLRRWRFRDGLSIREITKRARLSRNTVRKYLSSGEVEPRYPKRKSPSGLDDYAETLACWLVREEKRRKKQRKTAKQLHRDLAEQGYTGSYDRVAAFCREWRKDRARELDMASKRAYVPLSFSPGEAFQFDWGEDWWVIGGQRIKLMMAHFKLSYSRAYIVRAYPMQSHEMLFDAHEHAFRVLGGVPERGIYDNMKTAVDKVRSGKERDVNRRFLAMASHYLFEPEFCNPAAGWEKGQVEKAVQDARNCIYHQASSLGSIEELNEWLEEACVRDWASHKHPEANHTIAEMHAQEQPMFMQLKHPFDGYVEAAKRVTSTCLVTHERNRYSVPASYANTMISLRVYADKLVMVAEGKVVATHSRSFSGRGHDGQYETIYDWRHYLSVAQRKPGALRNGAPFKELPRPFAELQHRLLARKGGDREMADILALVLIHPEEDVLAAVEQVLDSEVITKQQVLNAISRLDKGESPKPVAPPPALQLTVVPKANINKYDQLRGQAL